MYFSKKKTYAFHKKFQNVALFLFIIGTSMIVTVPFVNIINTYISTVDSSSKSSLQYIYNYFEKQYHTSGKIEQALSESANHLYENFYIGSQYESDVSFGRIFKNDYVVLYNNNEDYRNRSEKIVKLQNAPIKDDILYTSITRNASNELIIQNIRTKTINNCQIGFLYQINIVHLFQISSALPLLLFVMAIFFIIFGFLYAFKAYTNSVHSHKNFIQNFINKCTLGIRVLDENDKILYTNDILQTTLNNAAYTVSTDNFTYYEKYSDPSTENNICYKAYEPQSDKWLLIYPFTSDWLDVSGTKIECFLDITAFEKRTNYAYRHLSMLNGFKDFIWTCDNKLENVFISDYAYEMTGYKKGKPFDLKDIFGTSYYAKLKNWMQYTQNENFLSNETILIKKDSTIINVQHTVKRIYDEKGNAIGISMTVNDITDSKKQLAKQQISTSIINSAAIYIAATDKNLDLLFANPGAYSMCGFEPYEPNVNILKDILPTQAINQQMVKASYYAIENGQWQGETKIKRKDGTTFDAEQQIFALYDDDKEIIGVGTIMRDISKMKEMQKYANFARERLEVALAISKSGVWEIDTDTHSLKYDSFIRNVFLFPESKKELPLNDAIAMLHKLTSGEIATNFLDGIFALETNETYVSEDICLNYEEDIVRYVKFYVKHVQERGQSSKYIGLLIDVTESVNLREELIVSKELAETANVAKSMFLSNMSHEMRTPMNAIIGMTKIAKNSSDMERIRDCLSKIETSSNHLLGIINDTLDLSKIESGKLEIYIEELDVSEILKNVINVVAIKTEEKNQNFLLHVTDNVPTKIFSDSVRLSQVIINLLSNAIKFTPDGGKVKLSIDARPYGVDAILLNIEVSDTGIGMTEHQLSKLFVAFEQADYSITKKFGGTGLGLAITKQIISLVGGEIKVKSRVNKGSTFTVTMPTKLPAKVSTFATASQANNPKALIMDNNKEIASYIETILAIYRIPCDIAYSSTDAYNLIKTNYEKGIEYSVIFIDYKTSEQDKLETIKSIKQDFNINSAMVLLSETDLKGVRIIGDPIGINEYMQKPVFPAGIISIYNKYTTDHLLTRTTFAKENVSFVGNRILVVDDVEINREIIVELLSGMDIEVECACDGMEAIDIYKKNEDKYDLILMDIQMPRLDGYSATKAIRLYGTEKSKSIPILAMTANAFSDDIKKAIESGMNGHLSKPIDEDKLVAELVKYLNGTNEDTPSKPEKEKSEQEKNIFGIDYTRALKMLNNNKQLYTKLLATFKQSNFYELFFNAIENNDLPKAKEAAHALKGVSANLCLFSMYNAIKSIDENLANGIEYTTKSSDIADFIKIYERTIKSVDIIILTPDILD